MPDLTSVSAESLLQAPRSNALARAVKARNVRTVRRRFVMALISSSSKVGVT